MLTAYLLAAALAAAPAGACPAAVRGAAPACLGASQPEESLSAAGAATRRQMKELEPRLARLEALRTEYERRRRQFRLFEPLLDFYDQSARLAREGDKEPPRRVVEEIEAFKKRVSPAELADFSAFLDARRLLRTDIRERRKALDQSFEALSNLRARLLLHRIVGVASGDEASATPSPLPGEEDFDAVRLRLFELRKRAQTVVGGDNDSFRSARERARLWASRRRLLGRALACAPFLAAAWTAARRRKARRAPERPAEGVKLPAVLPARAPESLAQGALVGGTYRIARALGEGSMGPVYEAFDTERQRPAVIKRIREEIHRSERDLEHFLAEARGVAALKHGNMEEIFSVFLDHERILLACELLPGAPLSRLLEKGPLPMTTVKAVVPQIASVLDYAHGRGVLHGDLKPSNVIVAEDGGVKVRDFSLALLARKTLARLSWARTGASLAVMAPEQELGEAQPQSDVYSLGVLLYHMWTGRPPYAGVNLLARKKAMDYELPSRLRRGLGEQADAILRTALQVELERRFPSAHDLAVMVATLPDELPGDVKPSS